MPANPPFLQDCDIGCQFGDAIHVVAYKDHAAPRCCEFGQQSCHAFFVGRIQSGCGFVEDQDLRPDGQYAGDGGAPSFSTTESHGRSVSKDRPRQPNSIEGLVGSSS